MISLVGSEEVVSFPQSSQFCSKGLMGRTFKGFPPFGSEAKCSRNFTNHPDLSSIGFCSWRFMGPSPFAIIEGACCKNRGGWWAFQQEAVPDTIHVKGHCRDRY
eukprot:scaffold2518_cov137-Skeletonema_menzelii.AAC.3